MSRKLGAAAVSGTVIDINEEFRVLTLQVISELILGMSPEESERIFPALYLPIVTEVESKSGRLGGGEGGENDFGVIGEKAGTRKK